MNDKERLEVAGKLVQKSHLLKDQKKSISEDIKGTETQMETAIIDQDENVDLRKLLSKAKKKMGERSELSKELILVNQALEQVILGKGDFDKSQIDFSDLEDEIEDMDEEDEVLNAKA